MDKTENVHENMIVKSYTVFHRGIIRLEDPMIDETEETTEGNLALRTLLFALEESQVSVNEQVELLIRVKGKEDRTLSIRLENTEEMCEILKRTIGQG